MCPYAVIMQIWRLLLKVERHRFTMLTNGEYTPDCIENGFKAMVQKYISIDCLFLDIVGPIHQAIKTMITYYDFFQYDISIYLILGTVIISPWQDAWRCLCHVLQTRIILIYMGSSPFPCTKRIDKRHPSVDYSFIIIQTIFIIKHSK